MPDQGNKLSFKKEKGDVEKVIRVRLLALTVDAMALTAGPRTLGRSNAVLVVVAAILVSKRYLVVYPYK